MPLLPKGDYSVCVAVADGSQQDHVQHHWIHDVLLFRSESSSVCTGLVGVPMHSISLSTTTPSSDRAVGSAG
jgi:lipopolysaccharide transport system ATP-binding protein